jgi:hypothetical protein
VGARVLQQLTYVTSKGAREDYHYRDRSAITWGIAHANVPCDQLAAGCESGLLGSLHCGSLRGPSKSCSRARCGQSIMNIRLWTPRLL